MKTVFFILIITSVISCNHPGDSFVPDSEMQGTWIMYEEGYSPGNGYVIKPVSQVPPLTMVFSDENQFSSTLQFLGDYKFYSVTKDPQSDTWALGLYKVGPDPQKDPDPSRLMYDVKFEGGRLKLNPTFPSVCIEGCHMGFKRLVVENN
jgi:hypothetical protein